MNVAAQGVCPECGVQDGHGHGCPLGPEPELGAQLRARALGIEPRRIGVLVPTVTGREEHLARCVATHCPPSQTVEWLLAVENDHPYVSQAWVAGVDRLLAWEPDYVVITCDDFEAVGPYWWHATHLCDQGAIAAPILRNAGETERWHSSIEDGEPGEPARCTRSPHMLTAADAARIFRVYRELDPVQYYGDFLLGDIGSRLRPAVGAVVAPGFEFIHHWAQVGRHTDEQNERDHDTYRRELGRLDHLCDALS